MAVVRRWAALFVTAPTHKPRCRLGRVEGRRVLAPEREIASLTDLSRRVDDKPMAIERASLSLGMLPNPLTVETSLYEVLAKSGLRRLRALQKISAINLGHANADLLEVDSGDAGLSIERTSYLGDNYNFVAELRFSQE